MGRNLGLRLACLKMQGSFFVYFFFFSLSLSLTYSLCKMLACSGRERERERTKIGCTPKGRMATESSKKGSEKVLGRVLGKGF